MGVPIISAMGAGNKLDPTAFKVADIYSTKMCPLAKVMRRELKSRDIKSLKVVYSEEKAKKPEIQLYDSENNKPVPGSVSFGAVGCRSDYCRRGNKRFGAQSERGRV